MATSDSPWAPIGFRRFIRAVGSSTGPSEIMTDAGRGYLKALGNPQGPHALACDWVGTQLARWFRLRTFQIAIMPILDDDIVPLGRGRRAKPGPAIVTRAEDGGVWGGTPEELEQIENPGDLAALVVFDTWIRNCDRFPPDLASRKPNYDNVFLSTESIGGGRSVLKAIDHNNAFVCGRDLNVSVKHIANTKDERLYGFFPAFANYVTQTAIQGALARLATATAGELGPFIDSVPEEWEVGPAIRAALLDFLVDRANFLIESGIQLPRVAAIDDEQQSLFPPGA